MRASPLVLVSLLALNACGTASRADAGDTGAADAPTTTDVTMTNDVPTGTDARDTQPGIDRPIADDVVTGMDATTAMDAIDDAPAMMDASTGTDARMGTDAHDVATDTPNPLVPVAQFSGFGEISGLQASRRYPGIMWGHRDGSGTTNDPLRTSIYAFRIVGGQVDRSFDAMGYRRYAATGGTVLNRNWEDMGISRESDGSYALWLGDIGNNTGTRNAYQIYKFREPNPTSDTQATLLATYQFQYPASAMAAGMWPNCESMFVLDGVPYILTKASTTEIYRFPGVPDGTMQTLVYVGRVREPSSGFGNLSYVDISVDERRAVVGTHVNFWVYDGGNPSLRGDAFVMGILGTQPPPFAQSLSGAMITGAVNFEGGAFMADSNDVVLGSESQSILYWPASRYE